MHSPPAASPPISLSLTSVQSGSLCDLNSCRNKFLLVLYWKSATKIFSFVWSGQGFHTDLEQRRKRRVWTSLYIHLQKIVHTGKRRNFWFFSNSISHNDFEILKTKVGRPSIWNMSVRNAVWIVPQRNSILFSHRSLWTNPNLHWWDPQLQYFSVSLYFQRANKHTCQMTFKIVNC